MFKNLKITVIFEKAVIITQKNPFDAVLAYLYANKLKREGRYEEYKDTLIELPFIKKTNGVYHTSYPIIEDKGLVIENEATVGKFDVNLSRKIGENPNKVPDVGRGALKSFVLDVEKIHIKEIVFYVCGDKEKIKELLKDFTHYGKKSSLDNGKIKEIRILEMKEDYSLFDKEGNPNRILPIKSFSNLKSERIAIKRPIYPYWERSDYTVCYI